MAAADVAKEDPYLSEAYSKAIQDVDYITDRQTRAAERLYGSVYGEGRGGATANRIQMRGLQQKNALRVQYGMARSEERAADMSRLYSALMGGLSIGSGGISGSVSSAGGFSNAYNNFADGIISAANQRYSGQVQAANITAAGNMDTAALVQGLGGYSLGYNNTLRFINNAPESAQVSNAAETVRQSSLANRSGLSFINNSASGSNPLAYRQPAYGYGRLSFGG